MVAVVARAWNAEARAPVARVRLCPIAHSTAQAALAWKDPEGRWASAPAAAFGDDLFDDGVSAVLGLGLEHLEVAGDEHGVVAPHVRVRPHVSVGVRPDV